MSLDQMPLSSVLCGWDELTERWALNSDEESALLGVVRGGPVGDPSSYGAATAEDRMRVLLDLAPLVERVIGGGLDVRLWLRRSNLNLGGYTPIEAMTASTEWARWLIRTLGTAS